MKKYNTNPKKGKIKRFLLFMVIIIVVIELFSPVIYNIRSKKSFSRKKFKKELMSKANDNALYSDNEKGTYAGIHVLHPYLGYVKNKDVRPNANIYGLMSKTPITKRKSNHVNILITGG